MKKDTNGSNEEELGDEFDWQRAVVASQRVSTDRPVTREYFESDPLFAYRGKPRFTEFN